MVGPVPIVDLTQFSCPFQSNPGPSGTTPVVQFYSARPVDAQRVPVPTPLGLQLAAHPVPAGQSFGDASFASGRRLVAVAGLLRHDEGVCAVGMRLSCSNRIVESLGLPLCLPTRMLRRSCLRQRAWRSPSLPGTTGGELLYDVGARLHFLAVSVSAHHFSGFVCRRSTACCSGHGGFYPRDFGQVHLQVGPRRIQGVGQLVGEAVALLARQAAEVLVGRVPFIPARAGSRRRQSGNPK